MSDRWYTVSEAAKLLGLAPETIRRRIKMGEYVSKKEGVSLPDKIGGYQSIIPTDY